MRIAFYATESFDQDLGSWDVSHVTDLFNFMGRTTKKLSVANDDSILQNWSQYPNLQSDITVHFGKSNYSMARQGDKDVLTNTYNWTIHDGGSV